MAQIINASYNSLPQQVEENKNNIAKSNVDITTANTNIAKNTSDITTANTNIAKNAIDITNANANITKNTNDIFKNTDGILKNTSNIKVLSNSYIEELSHKSGTTLIEDICEYGDFKIDFDPQEKIKWVFKQEDSQQIAKVILQFNKGINFEVNKVYKMEISNTKKMDYEYIRSELYPHDIYYFYINTTTFKILDEDVSPPIFKNISGLQFVQLAHSSLYEMLANKWSSPLQFQNDTIFKPNVITFKEFGDINMNIYGQNITTPSGESFFELPARVSFTQPISSPPKALSKCYVRVLDLGIVGALV